MAEDTEQATAPEEESTRERGLDARRTSFWSRLWHIPAVAFMLLQHGCSGECLILCVFDCVCVAHRNLPEERITQRTFYDIEKRFVPVPLSF